MSEKFNLDNAYKDMRVSNEFNTVPLRKFTATELDLLFSIMTQMRDRGTDQIVFTFADLKFLSKYNKETAISSFARDLASTYDKLIALNVKIGDSKRYGKFVFFTDYWIDEEEQTISIRTNKRYSGLINDLLGLQYTKIELNEVTSLRSSYSKNLYRLLKQYRTTGKMVKRVEDFRELLDIPESYQFGQVNQKVIKVAVSELKPYFKNLRFKAIKGNGSKSKKVVRVEFYFKPELISTYDESKYGKQKKSKQDSDGMSKAERKAYVEQKTKSKPNWTTYSQEQQAEKKKELKEKLKNDQVDMFDVE